MPAGVQTAGSIGDQHVDVAGLRRLQGIEDDRGGVGALLLRHHRDAVALAPGLQLFHGRGAKGVTGGQHDLVALLLKAVGELADGGRLAGAVDTNHQDHVGPGARRNGEWLAAGREDGLHVLSQGIHQGIGIAQFLA